MAIPITGRIEVVWLLLVQTTYSYYFALRLPKGLPRLLALLPLLPPSLLVTWRAPTVSERFMLSIILVWLVDTKLLLLAWGAGPAADPVTLSTFPRFFFSMVSTQHLKLDQELSSWKTKDLAKDGKLTTTEELDGSAAREGGSGSDHGSVAGNQSGRKSRSNSGSDGLSGPLSSGLLRRRIGADDGDGKVDNQTSELQVGGRIPGTAKGGRLVKWVGMFVSSQAGPVLLVRSMLYFTVEVCVLRVILACRHHVSELVLDMMLPFYLYFGCLWAVEGLSAVPGCLFGIEGQPQFNMPFLADSLADFWGRRWNLVVNNLLRVSVYEPVLKLLSGRKKPTQWERVVPTLATFLVSGLMHDVICLYGSKTWPTWELTAFFVLNGMTMVLEGFLLPPPRRSRVPRVLRWACTFSFLYITAYRLFFRPAIRCGLLDALEEVGQFVDWILGPIIWWKR